MTSASCNQSGNTRTKSLTNFSIESLIGADQSNHNHHGQSKKRLQQPHQSTDRMQNQPTSDNMDCKIEYNYIVANRQNQQQLHQYNPQKPKSRPKNFPCPACKMAFSNNGQLKNHVRIHTGERPFNCNHPDCNKTFTRNEELTRHKLIHTGVRPHACTSCGKRFGRKDHLKKHVRTHERKRLRKKVFVPTRSSYIHDDVFVPPKSTKSEPLPARLPQHHLQAPTTAISSPQTLFNAAMSQSSVITTLSQHQLKPMISTTSPTRMVGDSTATIVPFPTASAVQRLPGDYWSRWYNLMSFYQQHCQPIDRLGSLFRRSQ